MLSSRITKIPPNHNISENLKKHGSAKTQTKDLQDDPRTTDCRLVCLLLFGRPCRQARHATQHKATPDKAGHAPLSIVTGRRRSKHVKRAVGLGGLALGRCEKELDVGSASIRRGLPGPMGRFHHHRRRTSFSPRTVSSPGTPSPSSYARPTPVPGSRLPRVEMYPLFSSPLVLVNCRGQGPHTLEQEARRSRQSDSRVRWSQDDGRASGAIGRIGGHRTSCRGSSDMAASTIGETGPRMWSMGEDQARRGHTANHSKAAGFAICAIECIVGFGSVGPLAHSIMLRASRVAWPTDFEVFSG
ncbi:hypothetical protein LXA43DRAFT_629756 [Ganoderma leucocontextum]|nr:hypothetical protein LXA43DRAFT_629756 [Ganoderma leucocontextum]